MVKPGEGELCPWHHHPRPSTSSMMIKLDPNLTTSEKLNYLKRGHSVSLGSHSTQTCSKYQVRSSKVLANRGPSYPAQVPDIAFDTVNETHLRILIHENILDNDHDAFKRKAGAESTSDYFNQKHLVRDYLYDMHPSYDPNDIRGTVYNRSILKIRSEQKQRGSKNDINNDYHSNNNDELDSKSVDTLDDFLATDPTRPRSTGYSRGHLRSIAKVDTFGPTDSLLKSEERDSGLLPAPNTDRYKDMPSSVREKLNKRKSKSSQGLRESSSASSLFADKNVPQSWKDSGPENTITKNSDTYIKPNTTSGGTRQRTSRDMERLVPSNLLLDSNTKSWEWFRSYQKRLNDRERLKQTKEQHLKIKSMNSKLAQQQKNDLAAFEVSLKSKSMRV